MCNQNLLKQQIQFANSEPNRFFSRHIITPIKSSVDISIHYCTFQCVNSESGGAISLSSNGNSIISFSGFFNCQTQSKGSAIYMTQGGILIKSSCVLSSSAKIDGHAFKITGKINFDSLNCQTCSSSIEESDDPSTISLSGETSISQLNMTNNHGSQAIANFHITNMFSKIEMLTLVNNNCDGYLIKLRDADELSCHKYNVISNQIDGILNVDNVHGRAYNVYFINNQKPIFKTVRSSRLIFSNSISSSALSLDSGYDWDESCQIITSPETLKLSLIENQMCLGPVSSVAKIQSSSWFSIMMTLFIIIILAFIAYGAYILYIKYIRKEDESVYDDVTIRSDKDLTEYEGELLIPSSSGFANSE